MPLLDTLCTNKTHVKIGKKLLFCIFCILISVTVIVHFTYF